MKKAAMISEIANKVDLVYSRALWRLHEAHCQAKYIGNTTLQYPGYHFSNSGIEIIDKLRTIFTDEKRVDFSHSDVKEGYLNGAGGYGPLDSFSSEACKKFNEQNNFYMPNAQDISNIEKFFLCIKNEVEERIHSHFDVVNVICKESLPNANFGPHDMHVDSQGAIRKLVIYLNPPNLENGTTRLITSDGDLVVIESENLGWLLFDADYLQHSGLPPKSGLTRPTIELTIAPSLTTSARYFFGGLDGRYPAFPKISANNDTEIDRQLIKNLEFENNYIKKGIEAVIIRRTLKEKLYSFRVVRTLYYRSKWLYDICRRYPLHFIFNKIKPTKCVNIGGGGLFLHSGWLNLDEFPCAPQKSFKFSPTCTLPLSDDSMDIVYSSHCLEHLTQEIVDRLLSESYRVLKKGGHLVVILPNYDLFLECWENKDKNILPLEVLKNYEHSTTWKNRGVPDTLDNHIAYIFCSFWNDAYGHHFSGDTTLNNDAYFGPPVMTEKELQDLIYGETSPHRVAKKLRDVVVKSEKSYCFNHQTAWSKLEFEELVASHQFQIRPLSDDEIVGQYKNIIPRFNRKESEKVSMCISAVK
jgi:hypothetical protein